MRRLVALLMLVALGFVAWTARVPLLAAIGRTVVDESPSAPADVVILLGSSPVLSAIEAATLVSGGLVPRVLVFERPAETHERALAELGLPAPRYHEIARQVLGRLGVGPRSIVTEPMREAGTNAAVRAVARWVEAHRPKRVVVVTDRSHTRRTALLLRRALPRETVLSMRAQARDPYEPDTWWRNRASARELMVEATRWVNSLLLGDLWAGSPASP